MNARIALLPGTRLSDPTYARVLTELARALRRRGWEARTICPRASSPGFLQRFRPALVNVHFSGHLGREAAALTRAALRGGAGLILTFQDLEHPDLPPLSRRQAAVVEEALGAASAIAALTPELARRARALYPGLGRVHVIGNAVGAHWFSPGGRRDGPLTCVARLAPYKGIDLLLWAFSDLARRDPRARLAIYGRDFSGGRFQKLAGVLGVADRVVFHGGVGEGRLRRALGRAPLVVSASRRETYGMALLEAMAGGAPLLSTRVGAAGDLLTHGKTGWLIPPGDPAALSSALRRLWEDAGLRSRLGKAAGRAAAPHSWDDRAARYERVFQGALRDA